MEARRDSETVQKKLEGNEKGEGNIAAVLGVWMCVCERERDSKSERERVRERESKKEIA